MLEVEALDAELASMNSLPAFSLLLDHLRDTAAFAQSALMLTKLA